MADQFKYKMSGRILEEIQADHITELVSIMNYLKTKIEKMENQDLQKDKTGILSTFKQLIDHPARQLTLDEILKEAAAFFEKLDYFIFVVLSQNESSDDHEMHAIQLKKSNDKITRLEEKILDVISEKNKWKKKYENLKGGNIES